MAFSLSHWLKGKPEAEAGATPAAPGEVPPVQPPEPGEPAAVPAAQGRVTVRAVRTVTPSSAQATGARAPSARQAIALPVATPPESGESAGGVRAMPVPTTTRRISFGGSPESQGKAFATPARLERAPAEAPAPALPDVPVILEVGDFVDRLPNSFLQAGTLDRHRKVHFQSSELYSDLMRGRASVPASVIYQKCADIFSRPISATEDIEVALPLQKLVEQMSGAFQTREDQVAPENVGEIETPFLKVAQEDSTRLPKIAGSSTGPIAPPAPAAEPPIREPHRTGQISTITPPKGAEDFGQYAASPIGQSGGSQASKRPPATVRASVAGAKIRVNGAGNGVRTVPGPGNPPVGDIEAAAVPGSQAPTPVSPSHQVAKKTARIQIPPISLRVAGAAPKSPAPPAASGPPPGLVNIRPPAGETAPTFRSTPGLESRGAAATFRSTPPPAVKPPPPSFAPRRTNVIGRSPTAVVPPTPAKKETRRTPPPAARAPTAPLTSAPDPSLDDRRIVLKLAAIWHGLPAAAFAGEQPEVAEEITISLPFRLIEPQLSSGRVSIPLAAFKEALPGEYRGAIADDGGVTEVPLPLQEIFSNLPSNALSIRPDQVAEETGNSYQTPFSQKADEDAKRLGVGAIAAIAAPAAEDLAQPEPPEVPAPVSLFGDAPQAPDTALILPPPAAEEAPATEEPAPADDAAPAAAEPAQVHAIADPADANIAAEPSAAVAEDDNATSISAAKVSEEEENPALASPDEAPAAPPAPVVPAQSETVLQKLFMTEDELDAKTIVRLVTQMPGLNGCTVMFGDGLRLAGNFPENGQAEGFSAMSPPFYKRTANFASELKLGELQAFTIYTSSGLLSFFMHNDICLSVRHAGRGFLPGVREKLETVTRELAQMYSAATLAADS